MTNIEQLNHDATSAEFSNCHDLMRASVPILGDVTAMIRRLTLTPADAMVLMNAISATMVEPLARIPLFVAVHDPRMRACEIIDTASDAISNLEGVTK